MQLITPSFVAYLCVLAALVYTGKGCLRMYHANEVGKLGLGVACISIGLFLFITVVPSFQILITRVL